MLSRQRFAALLLSLCTVACGEGTPLLDATVDPRPDGGAPPDAALAPDASGPDGSTPAPATELPGLASRVSGVAPLAVFFDGTLGEVAQPAEVNGRREYADLRYAWTFGDAEAGTWALDGSRKDEASGYLSAHVYERAGTHEARLEVSDGSGVIGRYRVSVEVQDPDAAFGGSATVCLSNAGDFEGCPAGATQVSGSADFASIGAHLSDDTRVLLRRGDVWTGSETVELTVQRAILGAYGPCDNPDARGLCENAPELRATGEATIFNTGRGGWTDLRLLDLAFVDEGGQAWGAVGGGYQMTDVLFARLRARGFVTPLGNGHWEIRGQERVTLLDCDAQRARGMQIYVGARRLAVLGNHFANALGSHILRVWHAPRAVISHNELTGSSLESGTGRHALKLHGPSEEALADDGPGGLDDRTRYVVITDNVFGASGPWPVAIGPQDGGADERLSDILFARNRVFAGYGEVSASPVQLPIMVWASHVTVVNNLIHGEGASRHFTAAQVGPRGIEPPPVGVRILHNTIYGPTGDEANSPRAFAVHEAARGTLILNNLIQLPESGTLLRDAAADTVVEGNVMANAGLLESPSGADPFATDLRPREGSGAIDAAREVPVWGDITGAPRPQGDGPDVGAFEVR